METEEMRIPDVIKCLCVQFYFIDDNYYGKTLEYYINDESLGIAYKDIETKDTIYHWE